MKSKRDRRIKIDDATLYDIVKEDISAAEQYFDSKLKDLIIARYELLHGNCDYYKKLFPKLCEEIQFSSSDIKDAVEWMMPSMIEAFFGPDKIVGIQGRTPDDNPEPIEKVIKYQISTQNDGFMVLSQWIRDGLEAGLGSLWSDWIRTTTKKKVPRQLEESAFANLPPEDLSKIKTASDLGNGIIEVEIEEAVRSTDQPVLRNLQPGSHIWLPDTDMEGRYMFEAVREWVALDDLRRLQKAGEYRNVYDIEINKAQNESGDRSGNSLDEIHDAIVNYQGEDETNTTQTDIYNASRKAGQDGRNMVLVYRCFGKYDVNYDGILERCYVTICGGVILHAEIYEYSRNHVLTLSEFSGSYSRWKQSVADFLQTTQDLKSALMMQILSNVAYNNDRPALIDESQEKAIEAHEQGKKAIPVKVKGQNIDQYMKYLPENPMSPFVWNLLEFLTAGAENKVGVSRMTQGLDGDTLANMTATGVSKVTGASQQRLRLLVRNAAQSGMVRLFEHLIELNQKNLDRDLVVRIAGKYWTVQPDDINGSFDTEVVSNVGLNNRDSTLASLMAVFNQVIPVLMQAGASNAKGLYSTAAKALEQMGFPNPTELLGMTSAEVDARVAQQDIMGRLPEVLGQIMQQAGIQPQQAASVVQAFMGMMQPQAQAEEGQPNA